MKAESEKNKTTQQQHKRNESFFHSAAAQLGLGIWLCLNVVISKTGSIFHIKYNLILFHSLGLHSGSVFVIYVMRNLLRRHWELYTPERLTEAPSLILIMFSGFSQMRSHSGLCDICLFFLRIYIFVLSDPSVLSYCLPFSLDHLMYQLYHFKFSGIPLPLPYLNLVP